ncbi:uracil/xanthine transporter [Erwinia sp. S38]|uniref:uracil/xanthine transporter n=1 Tax=Erwinia sp. S38 TaxID=2769338 RepID=UPI00190D9B24|nr:uracil/xanthine transporter [Erwinia sp. S38]MBJ9999686.1 uracil/xanthine transporter [Erwinia sp. S38]
MINIRFSRNDGLSGLQWFFFIFCNTVVIPPTLKSVFHLSPEETYLIAQYSFLGAAAACIAQVCFGHRRAIMEGPGGLWWATILSVTYAESSQGTPLGDIAMSFCIGIAIAGAMTILIGLTGFGRVLSGFFTPPVMVVFMFLLGAQLVSIFFKGMLGIPFGLANEATTIHWHTVPVAFLTVMLIVSGIVFLPQRFARYAVLVGVVAGWLIFSLLYGAEEALPTDVSWRLFIPHGDFHLRSGIIFICVLLGIVNASNTFGALRGTDNLYTGQPERGDIYRRSFITTGFFTLLFAPLGTVPFSPFVSSIGLLTQTGDSSRRSFLIGSILFLIVALTPDLIRFFNAIPLPVSSAAMMVSYLPLLWSSFYFLSQTSLNPRNIYRIALPIFSGLFLLALPPAYLQNVPVLIRPLLGNGLLMGIIMVLVLERLVPWERVK